MHKFNILLLFSRHSTVAVVDTKRGYVGMCNRCLAQQGMALSKNSVFMGGRLNVRCGFLVKAESGIYQTCICG